MGESKEFESLIRTFHQMWDAFPGFARLIDRKHVILASNKAAEDKGFQAGAVCARVGAPESHQGCRMGIMLKTQIAQVDRPEKDRIRGWVPVEGHPDVLVHFTLLIPEE